MRNFTISLAALSLSIAALGPGYAQDAASVADIEATRIVIAPPQTELARAIKQGLGKRYFGAQRESRDYAQAQKLYFFYGERYFEPLWIEQSPDGKVGFSQKAKRIIEVFRQAELEGFRPSDYLTPELDIGAAGSDTTALAGLESAFSEAVARYAQDAYGGRVAPTEVNRSWTITPRRLNEADLLMQLASSDAPDKVLADLSPQGREFLGLKAALARFYDGSVVDAAIAIPDGALLKRGMKDERVTLLRQRLDVPEPEIPETAGVAADADITYDEDLVAAVKVFQESIGLTADGVVGPATIAALNSGSATTKQDIIANMETWRWQPRDFGDFNVWVNIPEFRLWVQDRGKVDFTTRVVVGTAKNQTPIFNDEIEHVVVNPYWNVPVSIATNEIAPKLVGNPGYLASQDMELLSGGKVINAAAVDWSTTSIRNFHVRQRPGRGNALGQVKFLFPNQHAVYLHDTPSKSLFQRSIRAYSHGCVRVQDPFEFANALLKYETGLSRASLEGQFGTAEKWNNLKKSVPVHLTYFTLRVDEEGTIRSYGDIYGATKRLIELLDL